MATEGSITTTTPAAAATATITNRTNARTVAPIYFSYSNQTGFAERYFVNKLYQELVANGFGDGYVWLDHAQGIHPDQVKRECRGEKPSVRSKFSPPLGWPIVSR